MDRNKNDPIIKLISFALGCLMVFYIFMWMLPYIEIFLALCGGWFLWQECERNNRRNRH